ncbi:Probable ubiquitin-like-specific protease 2B [Linum perenne]
MKSGYEVYEFGEADLQTDRADAEFLSKLKNPNLQKTPCQVDECAVARGSDVPGEKLDSLATVDADTIECDDQGDNPTVSTLMVGMDLDDKERAGQDAAALHLNTLVNGHDCHSKIGCCRTASSLVELEERFPCLESEARSIEQVAEDNIAESHPLIVPPVIATGSAVAASVPSTNCFDSLQKDEAEICIGVDYVVYQKKYSTGCTVVFSRDNIKISSLAASEGDQETYSLEKSIDDIVLIDSERLERFEIVSVKLHVLSKEAGNIDGTSGVEELEFVIGEPDWSRKCQQIISLNEKYTSLWPVHDTDFPNGVDSLQGKKYFPNFERSFEDVIYPEGDCDAVSISKRDVDLLEPETFINDTIIDFYIQYLKNQIPPEEKHRYHFFNSFFFRKLADLDKDPSSALDGRAAFLRVRKWTRKVDIFGKNYIFIPVNFGVPCILHMDSIKGTHAGLKNLVQSYLWEEWKQRQEETSEDVSANFLNLRFVPLELPQQENSFDCGLFLLHYLELFLGEAPANFNLFNVNKFSKFLSWDWFHPDEASLKRTLIQKLIAELLENRCKVVSSGDDGRKEKINSPDGCKESAGDIVVSKYSPSVGGHGNSSSFQAGQGIEMTLLETSSVRTTECVGDPSMVLRELFEPGVTAGSLLAQCSSFDQPSSYYQLNGAVGPMEGDAENGFMDFGTGDAVFQQIDGMPSHAGFSSSFPLQGFTAGASWNAETSAKEDVEDSSSESSSADSDDSDIGIIENCSLANGDARQKENLYKQASPLLEDNNECLTNSHASTSTDMLETRDNEGAEMCATNITCDSNASLELSTGEEKRSISMMAELPLEQNAMSSELDRDSTKKQEAGACDVTALEDDAHLESETKGDSTKKQEADVGVVTALEDDAHLESESKGGSVVEAEAECGLVEETAEKNKSESSSKRNLEEMKSEEGVEGVADEKAVKKLRLSNDEEGCR